MVVKVRREIQNIQKTKIGQATAAKCSQPTSQYNIAQHIEILNI